LLIAIIGVMAGVLIEGPKLSTTISPNLIPELTFTLTLSTLGAALIVLVLATLVGIPLSLGQVAVGAALGASWAGGLAIQAQYGLLILASWVLSPVVGFAIAFVLQVALMNLLKRTPNVLAVNTAYARLTVLGAFYAAYVLGANTLGLAAGMVVTTLESNVYPTALLGVLTTLGMALSRRTTRTVSDQIVGQSPSAALAAQLSGAFTVHLFTQFSMPISISQAVVGGILGAASTKRIVVRNSRIVREILVGWTIAPLSGAAIAFVAAYLLSGL
jgi:PiT family inorganic phosphate transporter